VPTILAPAKGDIFLANVTTAVLACFGERQHDIGIDGEKNGDPVARNSKLAFREEQRIWWKLC
jgi:hypothetical protein